MSTILFAISLLILLWSARVRYERRKYLRRELEVLERDRDFSSIYGGDAESEDEARTRESLEQGGEWRQKVTFELVCWSLHIVGVALAVVGAALWLHEDQDHTWSSLAQYVLLILIATWFAWMTLRANDRSAKLERDLAWLKWVLKGLHSSAVNMRRSSIDEYVELGERIDDIENK